MLRSYENGAAYVADREALPVNPYGQWNESVIDQDPTLRRKFTGAPAKYR